MQVQFSECSTKSMCKIMCLKLQGYCLCLQGHQLSLMIQETPDFGPYHLVSTFESEISWILQKFVIPCETHLSQK